jgi:beta-barrel assembly-enhancing protease
MAQALMTRVRRGATVVALSGATVAAGCAPQVTTQQEVAMGADYAAQINRQLPLVNDAATVRYINELGRSIAARADQRGIPYNFYIVNSDAVNAFAVPGGHIYLNRGLIERASNVSEVSGVLAHEIAHVVQRHGIEQWRRAQTAEMGLQVLYGVLLGRQPGAVEGAAIQVGGTAVFAGYSREAERDADREAVNYLVASGISPNGLVTFFEKLMELQQREPGQVEQWFATHPTTRERIELTRQMIDQTPGARAPGLATNTQAFQNFRTRLAGLQPVPQDRRR